MDGAIKAWTGYACQTYSKVLSLSMHGKLKRFLFRSVNRVLLLLLQNAVEKNVLFCFFKNGFALKQSFYILPVILLSFAVSVFLFLHIILHTWSNLKTLCNIVTKQQI